MSFTLKFGHCFKRFNSTLQPDTSGWFETEAVWKNEKDIDTPNWHIYAPGVSALLDWNYAYMPERNTYYWITDIISLGNNRWEIRACIDMLSTYKTAIMGTPSMIEYGFNTDASGAQYRLQDTRQNVSQVPTVATATADITGGAISTLGTYVLTAVGASGGVTAYALGDNNLRSLVNSINRDISTAMDSFDTVEEILKYLSINSLSQGSAMQAIKACTWIPIKTDLFSSDIQDIYLGDFKTGVRGRRMNANPIHKVETDIAIPWTVEDWRRNNTQLLMYVPFIGTVGIPVDQCNNATSLHITWVIELITGGISVRIDAGDYCVYTGSGNTGIPYAIGSSNVPLQNTISGSVQTIGGALEFGGGMGGAIASWIPGSGSDFASSLSTAGAGLSNMASGIMQTLTPVVQCAGTLGGSAAIGQSMTAKLTLLYYPPIDDAGFSAVYGHPVMRVAYPVAGYCKTRGFSLVSGARANEMIQISQMMDAGVFIE